MKLTRTHASPLLMNSPRRHLSCRQTHALELRSAHRADAILIIIEKSAATRVLLPGSVSAARLTRRAKPPQPADMFRPHLDADGGGWLRAQAAQRFSPALTAAHAGNCKKFRYFSKCQARAPRQMQRRLPLFRVRSQEAFAGQCGERSGIVPVLRDL